MPEITAAWIKDQIGDAGISEFLGQVGQLVESVFAADGQRCAGALGYGRHGFPVVDRSGIEEGF